MKRQIKRVAVAVLIYWLVLALIFVLCRLALYVAGRL